MSLRILLLALGAIAFCLPAPAAAEGRVLTVQLCGGGTAHIPLDGDTPASDHGCCGKACHAPDLRKRGKSGCCGGAPDDDETGSH